MATYGIKPKSSMLRSGDSAKANLSMGNHLLERVKDGEKDGDAISVGQSAGGDFSCSYPNPMIAPVTLITQQSTSDGTLGLRSGTNSYTKIAQGVTSGLRNISRALFELSKVGSPSGLVWAEIYGDSGGLPTGSVLATSCEKYNCAEISTAADFTFNFPKIFSCPTSATSKLHVGLAGDYSESGSNYINVGVRNTGGTGASWWNGSTWTSLTPMGIRYRAYYGDTFGGHLSTHSDRTKGVHGAGANTVATDADINTHNALTSPHSAATSLEKTANKDAVSGYAGLDASQKVIKDPANATATPTQNKIPIADGVGGTLSLGWLPATLTGKDADTLDTYHATTLPVSTPQQSALDLKAPVASPTFTGTVTLPDNPIIGALTTKNPPIDADKVIYRNSASSDVLVTSTWTQIKAFLKTYFDTLYNLYVHPNHSGIVTSTGDGATAIADGAIADAKLAAITTANKVNGSAIVAASVPSSALKGSVYVGRDLTGWDFTIGSFTADSAYHNDGLNVSAIVPAGATSVHLVMDILDTLPNKTFAIRSNGTNRAGNIASVITQIANTEPGRLNYIIPIDSDRLLDYYVDTGTDGVYLQVAGWFI